MSQLLVSVAGVVFGAIASGLVGSIFVTTSMRREAASVDLMMPQRLEDRGAPEIAKLVWRSIERNLVVVTAKDEFPILYPSEIFGISLTLTSLLGLPFAVLSR